MKTALLQNYCLVTTMQPYYALLSIHTSAMNVYIRVAPPTYLSTVIITVTVGNLYRVYGEKHIGRSRSDRVHQGWLKSVKKVIVFYPVTYYSFSRTRRDTNVCFQ